jgi:hypothetical protein
MNIFCCQLAAICILANRPIEHSKICGTRKDPCGHQSFIEPPDCEAIPHCQICHSWHFPGTECITEVL